VRCLAAVGLRDRLLASPIGPARQVPPRRCQLGSARVAAILAPSAYPGRRNRGLRRVELLDLGRALRPLRKPKDPGRVSHCVIGVRRGQSRIAAVTRSWAVKLRQIGGHADWSDLRSLA